MIGEIKSLMRDEDGKHILVLALQGPVNDEIRQLKADGCLVDITVKKWRKKRSRDANALCWVCCQELAEAIGTTKEEVYRKAIKDVGPFTPLPLKDEEVDRFEIAWKSNGIGWFIERTDRSKNKGYTLILAYYGSSTYDSKEMSRLIDWLMDEAKQMDITLKAGPELEEAAKRMFK